MGDKNAGMMYFFALTIFYTVIRSSKGEKGIWENDWKEIQVRKG
jgi:hypothetical protein